MTREEQIYEASIEYSENEVDKIISSNSLNSFISGAKWSDNNPKSPWISIKDDLPCNHSELISPNKSREGLTITEYVVAAIYDYKVLSRMYELDGKWQWETDEPTNWFPIPEPPK